MSSVYLSACIFMYLFDETILSLCLLDYAFIYVCQPKCVCRFGHSLCGRLVCSFYSLFQGPIGPRGIPGAQGGRGKRVSYFHFFLRCNFPELIALEGQYLFLDLLLLFLICCAPIIISQPIFAKHLKTILQN